MGPTRLPRPPPLAPLDRIVVPLGDQRLKAGPSSLYHTNTYERPGSGQEPYIPTKRKPARKPNGPVPKGVRDVITALALEGKQPLAAIARDFGVNHSTVERLAKTVQGLDPVRVAEIRRGLPALLVILAGAHAAKALENADSDPAMSVKSTFGAKLAVEAGRVAEPGAEAPGHTMLAFINQLNVHHNAQPPEVIDADAFAVPVFVPAPGGDERSITPPGEPGGPDAGRTGRLDWGSGANDFPPGWDDSSAAP